MAKEILVSSEDFYIVGSASQVDERARVLKHGDTFAVFDLLGDMGALGRKDDGIYRDDTRFLSTLTMMFGERRPVLLSSTVRRDNALLSVDLTNADILVGDVVVVPSGHVHLLRSKVLWDGVCHERIRIHNYSHLPVSLPLDLQFGCDFVDIFEVRGMSRTRRGERLPPAMDGRELHFVYLGLDGRERTTRIEFSTAPEPLGDRQVRFSVRVGPGESTELDWAAHCETSGDESRQGIGFDAAEKSITTFMSVDSSESVVIDTAHEFFDQWIERSLADLRMLRTETSHGPYAYAGVPWFSTAFGRDGIITALEMLWLDPTIARGALSYLAHTQATADDPACDAERGKILHETRCGEMAALGEVPFKRYYGSIDSTPLFVMLAGAYFDRTGDRAFIETIWPNVERALKWIDEYGDLDGDGFVEYARRSGTGLLHQGWKDSSDPVFHDDGTLAEAPIALCEVQAYAYAAKLAGAKLADLLGESDRAGALAEQAETLRAAFEREFWCEDLSTYAIALDGDKRLCRVRSSNAGHCLYARIASADRAARVAETLMDSSFFSGWGVRTVAMTEERYNPMSYHNGSIWPHDNAIIAAGLAAYGFKEQASQILQGLFDASLSFDLHRLPELFCGFDRRPSEGPTLYPVACAPQAWAAGAALMLLQSCLGLEIRGVEKEIVFVRPVLPGFLDRMEIRGLRIGEATVDLELNRFRGRVGVNVLSHQGDIRVTVSD